MPNNKEIELYTLIEKKNGNFYKVLLPSVSKDIAYGVKKKLESMTKDISFSYEVIDYDEQFLRQAIPEPLDKSKLGITWKKNSE